MAEESFINIYSIKFGFSEIHIRTNRLKYILLVDKVHIKMFKVSIALKIVTQVLFQITFVVNHDEKVSRNKKVSAQILFSLQKTKKRL